MMTPLQRLQSRAGPVDLIRSALMVSLAAIQPIAGQLAYFTGRGKTIAERSRAAQGPTTPTDGAFAIWGPIFLASFAFGLYAAARKRRGDASLRRLGWLAALAYAGNSAWSLQAQYRGLGWPSFAIIAASAVAASAATIEAKREATRSEAARHAALAVGFLAGWLTVASFANLEATLNETQGRPSPRVERRRAVALVSGATALAAVGTRKTGGNPAFAAAAAWGLGGIVLRNLRARRLAVAFAASAGLALVGATFLRRIPAGLHREPSQPPRRSSEPPGAS